jgi:hypothetical protein
VEAAGLLKHPAPLIQSMAEWTLSLRVKKRNATTTELPKLITGEGKQPDWLTTWQKRGSGLSLKNDYYRQLIHLDRHRSLAGITEEVKAIESRANALIAHPKSLQTKKERIAFEQALAAIQEAIAKDDLQAAHQSYFSLRLSLRELIIASRQDFPREGFVFYTNNRITGGGWNVNVAVTGGTNPPVGDLYVKHSADPAVSAKGFNLLGRMKPTKFYSRGGTNRSACRIWMGIQKKAVGYGEIIRTMPISLK